LSWSHSHEADDVVAFFFFPSGAGESLSNSLALSFSHSHEADDVVAVIAVVDGGTMSTTTVKKMKKK